MVEGTAQRLDGLSPRCDEGVHREGEFQPCEKVAVAVRIDPTEGSPYAVCAYHARGEMVPLSSLIDSVRGQADALQAAERERDEAFGKGFEQVRRRCEQAESALQAATDERDEHEAWRQANNEQAQRVIEHRNALMAKLAEAREQIEDALLVMRTRSEALSGGAMVSDGDRTKQINDASVLGQSAGWYNAAKALERITTGERHQTWCDDPAPHRAHVITKELFGRTEVTACEGSAVPAAALGVGVPTENPADYYEISVDPEGRLSTRPVPENPTTETEPEYEYGLMTEHGWIPGTRGADYNLMRRTVSHGEPEWTHNGEPVPPEDFARFPGPVTSVDPPPVPAELLRPDPDLMGSPEGDLKGLRELQDAARAQVPASVDPPKETQ